MAETGNSSVDLQAHERTWVGFKAMMTWGTVVSFLVAAFVVFLLAS